MLIFIPILLLSDDIKPNYDRGNMKFFDVRTKADLHLQCTHSSNLEMTWLVTFSFNI